MAARRRPGVRLIRTPRDAEAAARDWMIYLGHQDARMTIVGPDQGVDVESEEALAQVKSGQSATGRPVVQQIYGISELEGKEAYLFTVGGVTDEAKQWADRAGVHVFQLDLSGDARPLNQHAREAIEVADGTISGWKAVAAELELRLQAREEAAITAEFTAPGGFHGYWGIWIHSDQAITVTRDLAGASHMPAASVGEAVDWVVDALKDLKATYWDSVPMLTVGSSTRRFQPRVSYPEAVHRGVEARSPQSRPAPTPGAPIRVSASDVYSLLTGSGCERRVYLEAHGIPGSEPSPLQVMLMELGLEHEDRHRSQLDSVVDVSEGSLEDRIEKTAHYLAESRSPIYQGVLTSRHVSSTGYPVSLIGVPDFIIPSQSGHKIRDTKTALRVSPKERPDIAAQLRFYGFLYERHTGRRPASLEVLSGDGMIHDVDYPGAAAVLSLVDRIVPLKRAEVEPSCHVKWSYRSSCPYFEHCWAQATHAHALSTIPGLSRAAATILEEKGLETVGDLLNRYNAQSLGEVRVVQGGNRRRIGKRSERVLRNARALVSGEAIVYARLRVPTSENVVLFDLEGTPNLGDDSGYIYLWGSAVHGAHPLPYEPVFGGSDPDSDRNGWLAFLQRVDTIFEEYGEVPWLHWASYERVQVESYIERYSDWKGVGGRLMERLVDLYAIVRDSVALPVYSYGLKALEELVGFQRSQSTFGGDWSITVWQEAIETASPEKRSRLLSELAAYNKEDLEAMAAALEYLRNLSRETVA